MCRHFFQNALNKNILVEATHWIHIEKVISIPTLDIVFMLLIFPLGNYFVD